MNINAPLAIVINRIVISDIRSPIRLFENFMSLSFTNTKFSLEIKPNWESATLTEQYKAPTTSSCVNCSCNYISKQKISSKV